MRKLIAAVKYSYKAIFHGDEYARYVISEKIVKLIYPKYKFSEFGRLFLEDNEFYSGFYRRFCGDNDHSLDRKYFIKELVQLVSRLEGSTAECGVYTGATSYLICEASQLSGLNKRHYMFDSFEGLSRPRGVDGSYWKEGDLVASEEIVKQNLGEFPFCVYCKGWIPSQFEKVADQKFSFVHIDVDLYQPTLDSIAFFYDRLVAGGIIVCDDYGFLSCPGATAAMEEYFSTCPESIVHVPTGQAFIVKSGTK